MVTDQKRYLEAGNVFTEYANVRTFKNYYPFGMEQPGDEVAPVLIPVNLPDGWGIYEMTGWMGSIGLETALKVNLDYAPDTAKWVFGKEYVSTPLQTYEVSFDVALDSLSSSDNELKVTIKDAATNQIIKEEVYTANGNFKLRYLATGDTTKILFHLNDPTPNIGSQLEVTGIALNKTDFGDYRYGFNGKENDQEWGKLIQDYGFRLYNPAIAKFLSVDPLSPEYPFYTPYQFAGNKPIEAIDLDGLEEWKVVSDNFHQGTLFRATDKNWIKQQGEAVKAVFLLRRVDSDMQIKGYDNAYGEWTTVSEDPFSNDMAKKAERFVNHMQQSQSNFAHKAAPFFAAALAPIAISEITAQVSWEGVTSFYRAFNAASKFRVPFTGKVSNGLLYSNNVFGAGESAMLIGGVNLGFQIVSQIGMVAYRGGDAMDYANAMGKVDVADSFFTGLSAYTGNFIWSTLGSAFIDMSMTHISTPFFGAGTTIDNNYQQVKAEKKLWRYVFLDGTMNTTAAGMGMLGKDTFNPFKTAASLQGLFTPAKSLLKNDKVTKPLNDKDDK
ncbi:RHS repeat-associated core domain-containing protein [uncultured Microscilla sp.]|uniref:RHS repeat-associated core domain-containing protein n=1 Tax=uncultured Microscilla sp. TaxID=432653 RepID=UPI00263311DA|nr:RHS repeat-associated core domain-containing protein [uncultured Microscilla sp.]